MFKIAVFTFLRAILMAMGSGSGSWNSNATPLRGTWDSSCKGFPQEGC